MSKRVRDEPQEPCVVATAEGTGNGTIVLRNAHYSPLLPDVFYYMLDDCDASSIAAMAQVQWEWYMWLVPAARSFVRRANGAFRKLDKLLAIYSPSPIPKPGDFPRLLLGVPALQTLLPIVDNAWSIASGCIERIEKVRRWLPPRCKGLAPVPMLRLLLSTLIAIAYTRDAQDMIMVTLVDCIHVALETRAHDALTQVLWPFFKKHCQGTVSQWCVEMVCVPTIVHNASARYGHGFKWHMYATTTEAFYTHLVDQGHWAVIHVLLDEYYGDSKTGVWPSIYQICRYCFKRYIASTVETRCAQLNAGLLPQLRTLIRLQEGDDDDVISSYTIDDWTWIIKDLRFARQQHVLTTEELEPWRQFVMQMVF